MPGLVAGDVEGWFGPVVLVLARVAGLVATAPAWNTPGLGWRTRAGLTVLVAAIVLPAVASEMGGSPRPIPAMVAGELAVGAGMGLAMALVIAGARQAGELIGAQAGLAPATVLDPDATDGLTAMGHLYGLLALGAFLALDGPLGLVTALIESYRVVPVGGPALSEESVQLLFAQVGWALGLSLRAAAPVGLALVVGGLALGLLARVGGALQLASLTWPVRTVVGVALVMLSLAATAELLGGEWARMIPPARGPAASPPVGEALARESPRPEPR